jgi:phosphoenolpyruvate carboxykinase (GTP)
VKGRETAVGILPTEEELNLAGMEIGAEDLKTILSIDVPRWKQEMANREEHLRQFENLPEAIWEAHRRVAADLDKET